MFDLADPVFEATGCAPLFGVGAARTGELRRWCDSDTRPGQRLPLDTQLAKCAVEMLADIVKGTAYRPVRAVLFDKSPACNWVVPWHQDRTIAVDRRVDAPGFGPWSTKAGVTHVEPPFEILRDMLTVRLHLDDCLVDNAPLVVALGSHRSRVTAADVAAVADLMHQMTCTARAGDAWVYATPILHRSDRAGRPGRRRVVQIDYCAASLPAGLNWAA